MSGVSQQHRHESPQKVGCAVITVSDTRTLQTDTGGRAAVDLLCRSGHQVLLREIIPDDPQKLRALLEGLRNRPEIDVVLITGGTGLGSRDQTSETVEPMLSKRLPGYGELFRMLSYQEIGPAAMLSRAGGGLLGRTVVLTMPGSPNGVKLALERIILPELGHLVREARR